MQYNVPLIPQSTSMSCWASSMAMILSWREHAKIDPWVVAHNAGGASYLPDLKTGLNPNDTYLLERLGFQTESRQCYHVSNIKHMLATYGPLWVASWTTGPHIRVICGVVDGTLYINDPMPINKGSQYTMEFERLFGAMENLGVRELKHQWNPIYMAHLMSKNPMPLAGFMSGR